MSFIELDLKKNYRSLGRENILTSFLLPVLKKAKTYRRSVGYFTLSALIELYDGINELTELNDGEIRIITSPKITAEDYDLIANAYKSKEECIDRIIMEEFKADHSDLEYFKISEILKLIISGKLDIKIVVTHTNGMYHDKFGIITDNEGNNIVFHGSLNETRFALVENYEKIRVDYSWIESDFENVNEEIKEFEEIWNNSNEQLKSMTFSQAVRDKILEFVDIQTKTNKYYTQISKKKLRDYQVDAISAWVANGYNGILSMATGTGKTFTAISAAKELMKNKPDTYMVLIIVPYILLVNQWCENTKIFGGSTVTASSNEKHNDWLKQLQNKINSLNAGLIKQLVLVTTIDTYKTARMKNAMNRFNGEIILIADEVHNYGTYQRYKSLPTNVNYKIGLSATPRRHFDDEGSEKLINYFNGIVYEFPLEKAIGEFLVPYEYHPIVVYLSKKEQDEYDKKTDRIIKLLNIAKEDDIEKMEIDNQITSILNQRAKIIAVAEEKVPSFFKIYDKVGGIHNIVYCGAQLMKYSDEEEDEGDIYSQINLIQSGFNKRRIFACKYVSNETDEQKEFALKEFKSGENAALIAIKCLDEGVDIPVIQRAFILASTTNQKEFIQRRGRVLRLCPEIGKEKAEIYDFITLPNESARYTKGLIKRELSRLIEFSQFSLNKGTHSNLIRKLEEDIESTEN